MIVSGPPGAGKTTLAAQLAPALGLPMIAKDEIKESLFDSLGWSDDEWSRKLSLATYELLLLVAERLLEGGASLVLESNIHRDPQRELFLALRNRLAFDVFEVFCTADEQELERRSRERERHPGHHRAASAGEIRQDRFPLELDDNVLQVDTTLPESVDLDDIVAKIRGTRDGSSIG